MNPTLIGAIIFIIGAAIGAALTLIFKRWESLANRIKALEDCQKKRLAYNTAAGIEDAIAVALDLVRAQKQIKLDASMMELRTGQIEEILKILIEGPDAYDPERPAGPRPDGMKTEAQLFEEAARRNRGER